MLKKDSCRICGGSLSNNIGSIVKSGDNEYILCKECWKKSVSLIKLQEVMAVPVSSQSLELIKKTGVYAHPDNYLRKGGRYLAFYVCGPISAITHYAKVEYILKNVGSESLPSDYLDFIDKGGRFRLYKLEKILELKSPIIKGDSSGIQSSRNTTMDKLKNAKFINEI